MPPTGGGWRPEPRTRSTWSILNRCSRTDRFLTQPRGSSSRSAARAAWRCSSTARRRDPATQAKVDALKARGITNVIVARSAAELRSLMETEGRIFVLTVTATPGRMAFLREVVNEEKLTVGILDGHDR